MTHSTVEMSVKLTYPPVAFPTGITGLKFCIRRKNLYSVTEDS
jgi:hypothetical protein